MKIGVFGTSHDINEETKIKAERIGKILADNNHIVVTGGCNGNPHTAAMSALSNGGKAIAYAVGLNIDDHKDYHRDLSKYTEIVFQDKYFLDKLSYSDNYSRSIKMCLDVDAAVVIGGRVGTMFEVTVLSGMAKDIYVLEDSGGITKSAIKHFVAEGHKSKSKIVFLDSPEELVGYVGV